MSKAGMNERLKVTLDEDFWGDGRDWTMSVADGTSRVVFTLKFQRMTMA